MNQIINFNLNVYKNTLSIGNKLIKNTIVIHPLECNDANIDGSPGESTYKRYYRFAASGAGVIWFETMSISEQGRTNKNQLYLNTKNTDLFKILLSNMKKINEALCVAQISHGGKYCLSSEGFKISKNYKILDLQKEKYIEAVRGAIEAGFDGIDLKLCHGFLLGDVLFNLKDYAYFSTYYDRVIYVINLIKEIKNIISKDFLFTLRIDISEFLKEKNLHFEDLIYLVYNLRDIGVWIYSFTAKKYYIKPQKIEEFQNYYNDIFSCIQKLKIIFPDILTISPGFTMYKENAQYLGKDLLEKKIFDFIGFGRQALAYADFANDIIFHNGLVEKKCCIMCGECSKLRRTGKQVKCLRNSK